MAADDESKQLIKRNRRVATQSYWEKSLKLFKSQIDGELDIEDYELLETVQKENKKRYKAYCDEMRPMVHKVFKNPSVKLKMDNGPVWLKPGEAFIHQGNVGVLEKDLKGNWVFSNGVIKGKTQRLREARLAAEKAGTLPKEKTKPASKTKAPEPVVENSEIVAELRYRHQDELRQMNNRQTTIAEGFVYIATNPAWPNAIKIGSAIDFEDRLRTYQTGDPYRQYRMEYVRYSEKRRGDEEAVKKALSAWHLSGEWYELGITEAQTIIDNICKINSK